MLPTATSMSATRLSRPTFCSASVERSYSHPQPYFLPQATLSFPLARCRRRRPPLPIFAPSSPPPSRAASCGVLKDAFILSQRLHSLYFITQDLFYFSSGLHTSSYLFPRPKIRRFTVELYPGHPISCRRYVLSLQTTDTRASWPTSTPTPRHFFGALVENKGNHGSQQHRGSNSYTMVYSQ